MIHIQKALLEDINFIMQLEVDSFPTHIIEEQEIYRVRIVNDHGIIVSVNKLPVGALFHNGYGKILSVAVMPYARCKGIGKTLLNYAIENLNCYYLDVCEDWIDARSMYEHIGFVYTGVTYDWNGSNMLEMCLKNMESYIK